MKESFDPWLDSRKSECYSRCSRIHRSQTLRFELTDWNAIWDPVEALRLRKKREVIQKFCRGHSHIENVSVRCEGLFNNRSSTR